MYVTKEELQSLLSGFADTISALSDAANGLRTVTLLIAAALARQPSINKDQFLSDISLLIEENHAKHEPIPMPVLDFRAALVKHMAGQERDDS